MGSFLSLPLLSFLALPFYSSPATSFNLLLFTANWYILLLTHPPVQVELYGIILVRLLFYLAPALLFLLFDTLLPTVSVQLKAQGDLGLPGRNTRKRQGNIVFWSLFNVALGVALHIGVEVLLTRVLHIRNGLSMSKRLPLPYDMIKGVAILLVIRGVLQYAIHRYVLHGRKSFLKKLHSSWQHSIPAPYALVATYDHPLCYLLHHWVPLYVPAYILRVHLLPFLLTQTVVSLEEMFTYSGYSASLLPSAIMLPGMARRLDRHFIVKGKGNYAPWGVADWVLGTSVGADIADDMMAEWDKRDGDEKVKEIGDATGTFIDGVTEKAKRGTRKRSTKAR